MNHLHRATGKPKGDRSHGPHPQPADESRQAQGEPVNLHPRSHAPLPRIPSREPALVRHPV